VHIGAGTGYYSAILAELVGTPGRITAIEHDAALAALATRNLAARRNVEVLQADGTVGDFDRRMGSMSMPASPIP
jgi:protein-L-isoaspartate(D-aspartate) O-methyltransferase